MNNNRKIGILTWTRYWNYGTLLQAYAIYTAVRECCADTYLIDYAPSAKSKLYNQIRYLNSPLLYLGKIRSTLYDKLIADKSSLETKRKKMRCFIESNTVMTETASTPEELKNVTAGFDTLICGSDQIWTPVSFHPEYYLSFAPDSVRKIAYAPSFGVNRISGGKKKIIAKLLRRFESLSVREEQGREIVRQLTGQDAFVAADPVLLLSREHWESVAVRPRMTEPYVFCYILQSEKVYPYAKEYAQKNGLAVRAINESRKETGAAADEIIADDSPEEFVGLIQSAEMVVTDSYHGLLFSLLFHKPVRIIQRFSDSSGFSQNSRIDSILNIIGKPYAASGGLIDRYDDIIQPLGEFAESSREWLTASLGEAMIKEKQEDSKS